MINAYKVLGIRDFATQKEIRIAYRTMSKMYHPDLHKGSLYYEERFKGIQAAYDVLSNIELRMDLDSYLRQLHHEEVIRKQHEDSQQTSVNNTDFHTTNRTVEKSRVSIRKWHLAVASAILFVLVFSGSVIYYFQDKRVLTDYITESRIIQTDSDIPFAALNDSDKQQEESKAVDDKMVNASHRFSIDATQNEVRKIQGEPDDIVKVSALNQEIWYYEMSSITFENGRVSEYANIGNNLCITYYNAVKKGNSNSFSVGDTRVDVLKAQGNPTTTMRIKPLDQEIWYYGESRVLFVKGKVSEYSNNEQNLLVSYSSDYIH